MLLGVRGKANVVEQRSFCPTVQSAALQEKKLSECFGI
jgi:hypothetical protein